MSQSPVSQTCEEAEWVMFMKLALLTWPSATSHTHAAAEIAASALAGLQKKR